MLGDSCSCEEEALFLQLLAAHPENHPNSQFQLQSSSRALPALFSLSMFWFSTPDSSFLSTYLFRLKLKNAKIICFQNPLFRDRPTGSLKTHSSLVFGTFLIYKSFDYDLRNWKFIKHPEHVWRRSLVSNMTVLWVRFIHTKKCKHIFLRTGNLKYLILRTISLYKCINTVTTLLLWHAGVFLYSVKELFFSIAKIGRKHWIKMMM